MTKFQRSLGTILRFLLKNKNGKRVVLLLVLNVIGAVLMGYSCISSESKALTAFSYLSAFNILRLCSCFVSMWVQQQHPNLSFTFGYERFEVLSVFICTTLTQLGGFFIFKESIEGLIHEHHHVTNESHLFIVLLGCAMNFLVTYAVENEPFAMVCREAPANWIQDALFDLGKSLCHTSPTIARCLMLRLNPFSLLTNISATVVLLSNVLVRYRDATEVDTFAALFITLFTMATMFPLSKHCGMIFMHARPSEISSSVEKCVKELNTLEGLLEFKQENVWSISFGKYAGSFHVRIRRDANEQLLLAQLTNALTSYLHTVTIQISKDDWKTPTQFSSHGPGYEVTPKQNHLTKGNPFAKYSPHQQKTGNDTPMLPYEISTTTTNQTDRREYYTPKTFNSTRNEPLKTLYEVKSNTSKPRDLQSTPRRPYEIKSSTELNSKNMTQESLKKYSGARITIDFG